MKAFIRSFGSPLLRLVGLALCAVCASAQAVIFTNDSAITFDNSAYDGQDVVVSNCILTVEGPHTFANLRIAAGGTLTHSSSPSGWIVSLLAVTNQPLTLTGTHIVTLPHSNIVTGTLRVTDASATVVFTSDVDYSLSDLGEGLAGLQRTTNSAILDDSEVLVSYDVLLSSIGAGLNLTVSGNVEVEPGANINADGRGYSGNNGIGDGSPASGGGGAHGGNGGRSSSNAPGGVAYGVISQPSNLGSGGGFGSTGPGGAGGGLIRINVRSNVTIHGIVSANGQGGANSRSGGGAGGSIWITARSLAGSGTVSANGGKGEPIHGGGGGGGRIALEVTTNLFSGHVAAYGGAGFERGGAGTICNRSGATSAAWLVTMDNGGSAGAVTPFSIAGQPVLRVSGGAVVAPSLNQYVTSLLVESNSWLTCPPKSMQIEMTVANNAVFEPGGGVNLRGRGYPYSQGNGAGVFYSAGANGANGSGGGGGHAGYGGMGTATNLSRGGNYYDAAMSPSLAGSGGGGNASNPGGAGGGLLLLNVTKVLQLDGDVMADGERPPANVAGGGSGGSVRLSVGTLTGTGRISANGGSAYLPNGGGGSGGCIAVTFNTNAFTGTVTAFGGTGCQNGAAGTVYTKTNNASIGQLRVDAGGLTATNTYVPVTGTPGMVDVTVQGGARLIGLTSFRNLTLRSNATLLLSTSTSAQTVNVTGEARIEAGAVLSLDGLGYASGAGPGAGRYSAGSYPSYTGSGGGGGHGGYGATGVPSGTQPLGGNAYDALNNPNLPGSGGGGNTTYPGGSGGGALRLNVTGLLHLDGRISADGLSATNGGAGGGSGGSLWLGVGGFSGAGLLTANGGVGDLPNGGGGGGGRILVTCKSNSFAGTMSAYGGAGYLGGGAGTVYFKPTTGSTPLIVMDNGGIRGTNTPSVGGSSMDLVVRGGAVCSGWPVSLRSLFIGSNSWLHFYAFAPLSVTENVTIEKGGGICADGLGEPANRGGRYWSSGQAGGGGGHGGFGGCGAAGPISSAGGSVNTASLTRPTTSGGGGGSYYNPPYGSPGTMESAGGGPLNISMPRGRLQLDGSITANGMAGTTNGGGGGAGGSVLLEVGILAGSGLIAANGGSGDSPNGGGGGGGRVAVYWTTNEFTGTISAKGGAGFLAGGAGTIYIARSDRQAGVLRVDNGGQRGTNTLVTSLSSYDDLQVAGGAMAVLSPTFLVRKLDVLTNSAVMVSNQVVTVTGDATIQAGAAILADGLGYGPAAGPGAGSNTQSPRGGGSHGGIGGANITIVGSGSVQSPTTWGSGGGNAGGSSGVAPFGGSGGGAVNLKVTGTLTVDGRVSASGNAGGLNSGGGAGGSVWLTAGTLAGSGAISANGGAGNGTAGGGGGGRVAVQFRTNLFAGALAAIGGAGGVSGGAGTIYLSQTDYVDAEHTGAVGKWLSVDNGGLDYASFTPLTGLPSHLELSVANGAVVCPQSTFPLFQSVNIGAEGIITSLSGQTRLELAALGDVNIQPGGMLSVDRRGFGRNAGDGAGRMLQGQGGGGGYGGAGGASAMGAAGGVSYGSETGPLDRGSGGGAVSIAGSMGSEGGGAIRLSVGGALNVEGTLSAHGNSGTADDSGGGAGGSLWVRASELTGSGVIAANGGDGEWFNGGGGGGGRIAIYSPANTFTGLVSVVGGLGANSGEAGTVVVSTNLPGFDIVAHTPTGVVSNVVTAVDLSFSEIVSPGSVSAEDFLLFTPVGVLPQTNLTANVVGLFTVQVIFPTQNLPGEYRLAAGPGLENLFGRPLSQVYTGSFTVVLPTISGSVTNAAGQGIPDVVLQPDGGLPATTTDAAGQYAIGVPPGWAGSVVPVLESHVFVPGTRSYTNVTESLATENYLMVESIVPELNSIARGTELWLNWNGIPGVSYQVMSSTNLLDWYPWGEALLGTNGAIQLPVPVGDPPAAFFRLKASN